MTGILSHKTGACKLHHFLIHTVYFTFVNVSLLKAIKAEYF